MAKNGSIFFTDHPNYEAESLEEAFLEHMEFSLVKDRKTVTPLDSYKAVALAIRDRLIRRWLRTQYEYDKNDVKKVFYFSMEFLMGRLLGNILLNMGFYDECYQILKDLGYNLEDIREIEPDMGLGNGGLGRLAACFMDSMATLELPAVGYGIRYEFGIFRQEIRNGYQIELPDNWLRFGNPWEIVRPEHLYRVKFYGRTDTHVDDKGKVWYQWVDTQDVYALAYDIPIPAYGKNNVNNLRLWQAKATSEFDFNNFNSGDYLAAVESKNTSENISRVLYPNDNFHLGKILRLQQEYFFVSASLQDIIRGYKNNHSTFEQFPDKVAVQLNDTHPAIAIPELMRIFLDEEGIEWEEAWDFTRRTFSYTNHTIMPEAMERWSQSILGKLLPRHLQIINEINRRFVERARKHFIGDAARVSKISIIEAGDDSKVR
ncbi:MAG TPA: glycogen/starch/alpha-glucan family phosphorylase, partial [Candidatus Sumerlaeota bacterium]|nr:glycogen/starch/alpha-glucan family phosphorylase [Candidatus Sumerlaeota bacterium]